MHNNFYVNKLNLVFGTECNCNCKYCFEKVWNRTSYKFNPIIIKYIKNKFGRFLPEDLVLWFFGGEPLLYWDNIKLCLDEFKDCTFDKTIVTNGTLLTKDIVDTLNKYNVLVLISHDGALTKDLRGYDVFETKLDLIKQINRLQISSVVTNNCNMEDIDTYIANILGRHVPIIFNRYKTTNYNLSYISEISAEKFVEEYYDFYNKRVNTIHHQPKLGIQLGCDGKYRNPFTGHIVAHIDENTLKFVLDEEQLEKEKANSNCLFENCEYYNFCEYPKIQIENNTYCRELGKATQQQYLDPFKAVERIGLYLGSKCNNNCIYCRDKFLSAPRPEANEKNIQNIITFLKKFRYLKVITFIGGEPLEYIDYIKIIISELKNKQYFLITNGKDLLNDDIYEYILNTNNIHLSISHDGPTCTNTRGYDIFSNPTILSRIQTLYRKHRVSISSVISKDSYNVLETARYFINIFDDTLNWVPMLVKGVDFSKDIPTESTLDSIKKFLSLFKYSKVSAKVLLSKLSEFEMPDKIRYMYIDLDLNIGFDPLDTTHTFSKDNYVKYIANMRNESFPVCKDCKIKSTCTRNPSDCNTIVSDLRYRIQEIIKDIMKQYGFTNTRRFMSYVRRYTK